MQFTTAAYEGEETGNLTSEFEPRRTSPAPSMRSFHAQIGPSVKYLLALLADRSATSMVAMIGDIKRLARKVVTNALASRQYHLIPEWHMDSVPLTRHLRKLFAQYSIECVLDVGGNLGQYASLLRTSVGFTGRIISFEPVSRYAEILSRAAQSDANWSVVNCALGAESSVREITVTKSPGLNSFLEPSTTHLRDYWGNDPIEYTESVSVRTLDDALLTLDLNCVEVSTYLKIDTQGFDLEVLRGARHSLPHFRALQTEASVLSIYDGMPSYEQTLSTLISEGFEISGMFPVTLDRDLRLVEFDCVAINSRFVSLTNADTAARAQDIAAP